ncbi:hypothetical protein [Streptomyces eurythermus]|uniref:hypothetical protein n=1 Tax=Streptomyces eurythermus TaxID=42237 RepID=UPI00340E6DFD
MLLAVLLWLLDAIGTGVALLTGLAQTDFNPFEPDPHTSVAPAFEYVAGFAGVVLLSAIGVYRLGYRMSVAAQTVAGLATLAFCAAGLSEVPPWCGSC